MLEDGHVTSLTHPGKSNMNIFSFYILVVEQGDSPVRKFYITCFTEFILKFQFSDSVQYCRV